MRTYKVLSDLNEPRPPNTLKLNPFHSEKKHLIMMGRLSGGDSDSEPREWDSAVQLDPLLFNGASPSPDPLLYPNNRQGYREISRSNTGLRDRNQWLVHEGQGEGVVKSESAASVHNPCHGNKDLYFRVEGK